MKKTLTEILMSILSLIAGTFAIIGFMMIFGMSEVKELQIILYKIIPNNLATIIYIFIASLIIYLLSLFLYSKVFIKFSQKPIALFFLRLSSQVVISIAIISATFILSMAVWSIS